MSFRKSKIEQPSNDTPEYWEGFARAMTLILDTGTTDMAILRTVWNQDIATTEGFKHRGPSGLDEVARRAGRRWMVAMQRERARESQEIRDAMTRGYRYMAAVGSEPGPTDPATVIADREGTVRVNGHVVPALEDIEVHMGEVMDVPHVVIKVLCDRFENHMMEGRG